VLLDHSLRDGAVVPLPVGARLFSNSRMDIYRLAPNPAVTRDSVPRTRFKPHAPRARGQVSD
jgi:hypothetical protein